MIVEKPKNRMSNRNQAFWILFGTGILIVFLVWFILFTIEDNSKPITKLVPVNVPVFYETQKLVTNQQVVQVPVVTEKITETQVPVVIFGDDVSADKWNAERVIEILRGSSCYQDNINVFNTTIPNRYSITSTQMGSGIGNNTYTSYILTDYFESNKRIGHHEIMAKVNTETRKVTYCK